MVTRQVNSQKVGSALTTQGKDKPKSADLKIGHYRGRSAIEKNGGVGRRLG
jgi:hypothetical protein